MKTTFHFAMLICVALAGPVGAQTPEETRWIQVLQSGATPSAKEDACRRLKQIGTAQSIPTLARLITDEHLYQSACDALETLPSNEADQVLLGALMNTGGKVKAGIIHTLGERRYQPATAELTRLLSQSDPFISTAAARALGRIGTTDTAQALRKQIAAAPEPLRSAIADALLDCAAQFLAAGKQVEARRIYAQFNTPKKKEHVRVAAYSGLIRAAESGRALELVRAGLVGNDVAQQAAALQLAGDVQDPKATAAFTSLLSQASPAMQIALLRLLKQRGDATAAQAVFLMAQNQDATVRVAALQALGTLGDATTISLLANAATSRDTAEQKAARQALIELRRGAVADTMIVELASASPDVQAELIRALTARMDKASAPRLLELAGTENPATRQLALRGLEQLADSSQLSALVKLLAAVNDDVTRAQVQSVFEVLADRIPTGQAVDVSAITRGLTTADGPTRIAMLKVAAFFADVDLADAVRTALQDSNPHIRSAAERAVCNSRDVKLIPDLLELAKTATNANLHALALEGAVRLVRENATRLVITQRVAWLRTAYELAWLPEERRMILSALTTAPNLKSLQIAQGAWSDVSIRAEAEVAILQIAKALLDSELPAATTSLRRLAEQSHSDSVRTNAQSLLKQFDSGWLASGPYRHQNKTGRELFDLAFPPEHFGSDTNGVIWRRAPGTADLTRRGEVDLQTVVAGDHAVVYVKTQVYASAEESVVFAIGSDDGIKLWVNGELIHANNAVRGLTPGEDRANGKLRLGWNTLFAKITQATAGCGMTLEIKNADGSEIPGLQFSPYPETAQR